MIFTRFNLRTHKSYKPQYMENLRLQEPIEKLSKLLRTILTYKYRVFFSFFFFLKKIYEVTLQ